MKFYSFLKDSLQKHDQFWNMPLSLLSNREFKQHDDDAEDDA